MQEPQGARVGATVPVGRAAGPESAAPTARTGARRRRGSAMPEVDGARRSRCPKVPLAVGTQHRAARPTAPARGAVALARASGLGGLTARRSLHHALDRDADEPRRPGTKQVCDATRDISSRTSVGGRSRKLRHHPRSRKGIFATARASDPARYRDVVRESRAARAGRSRRRSAALRDQRDQRGGRRRPRRSSRRARAMCPRGFAHEPRRH